MPPIARGDDKVLVAVRVRPLNDAERANGGGEAWSVASGADNTISVISHGGSRSAHGTGTKGEVRMRVRVRACCFSVVVGSLVACVYDSWCALARHQQHHRYKQRRGNQTLTKDSLCITHHRRANLIIRTHSIACSMRRAIIAKYTKLRRNASSATSSKASTARCSPTGRRRAGRRIRCKARMMNPELFH